MLVVAVSLLGLFPPSIPVARYILPFCYFKEYIIIKSKKNLLIKCDTDLSYFLTAIKEKDCADLQKSGDLIGVSGVYAIKPDDGVPLDVYCDQKTAGGGWTVIQKRLDGSVDFCRGWADYKRGFGDLNGEFWLGLDNIHRLTKEGRNIIRVELEDVEGNTAFAEYDMFAVANEGVKYELSLGSYSGEGMKLSKIDH